MINDRQQTLHEVDIHIRASTITLKEGLQEQISLKETPIISIGIT